MGPNPASLRNIAKRLPRPAARALYLTHLGHWCELILHGFWPVVVFILFGMFSLGLNDALGAEIPKALILGIFGLGVLASLLVATWRFRAPKLRDSIARVDRGKEIEPIASLLDRPALLPSEGAAQLWQHHISMAKAQAETLAPSEPDLRLSKKDPYAIRYLALLLALVAIIFLPAPQRVPVKPVNAAMLPPAGPLWEGWVEPPPYTGDPVLYLNDLGAEERLELLAGTQITVRYYDEDARQTLEQSIEPGFATTEEAMQKITLRQSGHLRVDTGTSWEIAVIPDRFPEAEILTQATASIEGPTSFSYRAEDDYDLAAASVEIALDLQSVERRYGLARNPDPRPAITRAMSLPISGSRKAFEARYEDVFQKHPWANLPVLVTISLTDAAQQTAHSPPKPMRLATPRFFDAVAAALIEQRQALLWSHKNAKNVALMLRAISYKGERLFPNAVSYLRLQRIITQLETAHKTDHVALRQEDLAEMLWSLANALESGDIDQALARLKEAQERLNQAMRNGASKEEIEKLMQDLRHATDDYMRQLSREARRQADADEQEFSRQDDGGLDDDTVRMTQQDLQAMMDRIQELMEEGRMAEAQQALEEYNALLQNMEMARQNGSGGQSAGEQALDGLSDTLREQQQLSDEAFRDLQNQQGQDGQNRPQNGNGQQGQGDAPEERQDGRSLAQELAERQNRLEEELSRQRRGLTGQGGQEEREAQRSLDEAEDAMRNAEGALREQNLSEAIDEQSTAIDALREGIRNLGDALNQQRAEADGIGDQAPLGGNEAQSPLGQDLGSGRSNTARDDMITDETLQQREDEIIDEIRKRQANRNRSERERAYLDRLLEKF